MYHYSKQIREGQQYSEDIYYKKVIIFLKMFATTLRLLSNKSLSNLTLTTGIYYYAVDGICNAPNLSLLYPFRIEKAIIEINIFNYRTIFFFHFFTVLYHFFSNHRMSPLPRCSVLVLSFSFSDCLPCFYCFIFD